jgi:hypothetical protein
MNWEGSRRNFLAGSVGFAALGNPIAAAAQSVGVKAGDLPDLTIKEVKVYVTDLGNYRSLNGETWVGCSGLNQRWSARMSSIFFPR